MFLTVEHSKLILDLFSQWGIIYCLPNHENIILDPTKLSDIFSRVISSHISTTNQKQLFKDGILKHDELKDYWYGYDIKLYPDFLFVLHQSELALELFDETGKSLKRSLIPALLPENNELAKIRFVSEIEIRYKLKGVFQELNWNDDVYFNSNIHGCIKIEYDCLLSNFFPRLYVRLRSMRVICQAYKNVILIEVPEWNNYGKLIHQSYCCIIERRDLNSLILIPLGDSYSATSVSIQSIKSLSDEPFIAIQLENVKFEMLIDDTTYGNSQIKEALNESTQKPVLKFNDTQNNEMDIDIYYLIPFIISHEINQDQTISMIDKDVIKNLENQLNKYKITKYMSDKLYLSSLVSASTSIFRSYCLKIDRKPNIIWLVYKLKHFNDYYLVSVSPSLQPSLPWSIVWESAIKLDSNEINEINNRQEDEEYIWRVFSESLKCLFLEEQFPLVFPDHNRVIPIEWVSYVHCYKNIILDELKKKEELFLPSKNHFGQLNYYSKKVLENQQGKISNITIREAYNVQTIILNSINQIEESITNQTKRLENGSQGNNQLNLSDEISKIITSLETWLNEFSKVDQESAAHKYLIEEVTLSINSLKELRNLDNIDHKFVISTLNGILTKLSNDFSIFERVSLKLSVIETSFSIIYENCVGESKELWGKYEEYLNKFKNDSDFSSFFNMKLIISLISPLIQIESKLVRDQKSIQEDLLNEIYDELKIQLKVLFEILTDFEKKFGLVKFISYQYLDSMKEIFQIPNIDISNEKVFETLRAIFERLVVGYLEALFKADQEISPIQKQEITNTIDKIKDIFTNPQPDSKDKLLKLNNKLIEQIENLKIVQNIPKLEIFQDQLSGLNGKVNLVTLKRTIGATIAQLEDTNIEEFEELKNKFEELKKEIQNTDEFKSKLEELLNRVINTIKDKQPDSSPSATLSVEEFRQTMDQLKQKIEALQVTTDQVAFEIHKFPLLFVIEEIEDFSRNVDGFFRKSLAAIVTGYKNVKHLAFRTFRFKFYCNVCGNLPNNNYTIDIPRGWFLYFLTGLEFTLIALEAFQKIHMIPIPAISTLVHEYREGKLENYILRDDAYKGLIEFIEGKLDNTPKIQSPVDNIDVLLKTDGKPSTILVNQINLVKKLFHDFKVPDASGSGLEPVKGPTGRFAWACSDNCKNQYHNKGVGCLDLQLTWIE